MRKVFIILLVVLAAVATGASVWALFRKVEVPAADTLYDAVPLDAGLIVDVRDYGELCRTLRENDLWRALRHFPAVGGLDGDMMLVDSAWRNSDPPVPFHNNVIFSFHPVGNAEMQSVGYVKVDGDREARNLMERIEARLRGKATVTRRSYDEVMIADVAFDDGGGQMSFSCAYRGGIFIFSRSAILLEYAIRQVAADAKIIDSENLAGLIRSAGKNAVANIYVNYSLMPRMALSVFDARHRKLLEPLARFGDWTELDVNVKSDLLLLNGFTECGDAGQWFDVFLSQPAIPAVLTDAMPSTTFAFLWLGVRRLQQYFTDYGDYLAKNRDTGRKKELERLRSSYQIDLQADFAGQFEDEAALVYANVGQERPEEAPFALFRIKSAAAAIEMIESWQTAIGKRSREDAGKTTLVFDRQLSFTAYRLPFDVPACLFGDVFADGNRWCVVADNYLVFGSSPALLNKYLRYTTLHASLQTEPGYGKLVDLSSSRSNLMFYCNPALMEGFFEYSLKGDRFEELQEASDVLPQMPALVYQLNSASGKLYNSLFLKYSPTGGASSTAGTQVLWESLLDTAILFKPQLVKNHTTGDMDIFVQDVANNACLLNTAGRIVWKIQLPEAIISPVYQLDVYRNGKLQMLFNTRNYIYIVDRLGKFVDKFPLRLKSPATGSVALFDYDNNRQYRMMIACEDRKVYVYEKTGKPVTGWSFKQSEYPVQTEISHIRADGKDYIVFADKYRVYILDRQGRTRVSPEYGLPVGSHTALTLDRERSRLLLTDTAGTVHYISLTNGSMTKQTIKAFPSSHFFVFQDVDGDGHGDFIFAADNRLEVYRQDARQIINVELEETITLRPYVYEFAASDARIGVVQPGKNQIWLYDNRGKVSKGFPLKGSTLFSVGYDNSNGGFNLFVGSANNFLYNYSVK